MSLSLSELNQLIHLSVDQDDYNFIDFKSKNCIYMDKSYENWMKFCHS